MGAVTNGIGFNPANTGSNFGFGAIKGFGPAPVEQNPMDSYGGLTTPPTTAPTPAPAPGFQTSWEMAGYPTLEAWKAATGGTGGAQLGFGPAPMPTGSAPGGKGSFGSQLFGAPALPGQATVTPQQAATGMQSQLFGAPNMSTIKTGLMAQPRTTQQQSTNMLNRAANRFTKTRNRPISGFF